MESTTYNIHVVSTTDDALTRDVAGSILDVCREHLDETLPDLDPTEVRSTSNDHDITLVEGVSIDIGVYNTPAGHLDDVLRGVEHAIDGLDLDAEIIEYSPQTDEYATTMGSIVSGQVNDEISCFADGTPAVSLRNLKTHLDTGDLEAFVRAECTKIITPATP